MKHRRPGAFTLLEMLVVIGILAAVAALLVPSLQTALSKSRSAQCMNNLRQIFAASVLYSAENHGQWPPSDAAGPGHPFTTPLAGYLGPFPTSTTSGWRHSLLICPDDRYSPPDNPGKDGVYQIGSPRFGLSYAQNAYLTSDSVYYKTGPRQQVEMPSRLVLYMDWESHYLASLGTINGENGGRRNALVKRHEGYINAVFADGHLARVKIDEIPDVTYPPAPFWAGRDSGTR